METKKCTVCKEDKELCEFNKNKTKKDGLNNVCRECSNKNSKKHYSNNKNKHKENVKLRNDKITKENRKKIFEFYKTHPCVDCGESNPIVLECDHKIQSEKKYGIAMMVQNAYSWESIEEEIKKCDVRCANCHRIRTAKQLGWYEDLI
jgi:hypothetical protein